MDPTCFANNVPYLSTMFFNVIDRSGNEKNQLFVQNKLSFFAGTALDVGNSGDWMYPMSMNNTEGFIGCLQPEAFGELWGVQYRAEKS